MLAKRAESDILYDGGSLVVDGEGIGVSATPAYLEDRFVPVIAMNPFKGNKAVGAGGAEPAGPFRILVRPHEYRRFPIAHYVVLFDSPHLVIGAPVHKSSH